ncbi:MAG TPA: helix-turn-helix transcriptional regulator [Actinoallomurus sp.]|nr:helix-turn-helix transcriptional regulator [Actinoallomurus sp.]
MTKRAARSVPGWRAELGRRLRYERDVRGWSRSQLAARLRSAPGEDRPPEVKQLVDMIKQWEHGDHAPGPDYQRRYCHVFGMDVRVLFAELNVARSPWLVGGDGEIDRERLVAAVDRPELVDAGVVGALGLVLAGQRRLEDAMGASALLDPVGAQLVSAQGLLRDARGKVRGELGRLVADWTTFTGWLHAAVRDDAAAIRLFSQAEELADEAGYGTGAALATSFRGYVARQQGRPLVVVRAAGAAMATPGVHPAQAAFDALQAAQGYAELGRGEHDRVRELLDRSAGLAGVMGEPPPAVYWYSEPFFKLNIGVALAGIGEHRDAVVILREGLAEMPADQRGAEWVREYEEALAGASEKT